MKAAIAYLQQREGGEGQIFEALDLSTKHNHVGRSKAVKQYDENYHKTNYLSC